MTEPKATRPRDVACPKCGAPAGVRCESKSAGRAGYHSSRKALAAQTDYVPRSEEATGVRAHGEAMVPVYLRVPQDLIDQIPAEKGRRNAFIRDAIRLALGGDAARWKRRYEHEREQRARLDRRLEQINELSR